MQERVFMTSTTNGKSVNYNMQDYYQKLAQQGWQCPICKRVLAPFVTECPCGGQGMQTLTVSDSTGTLTLNNEEISKHITIIDYNIKE